MDYREIYKGRGIKVYHEATFGGGPTHWLFDIYDQRDSNLVYGGGSADTEPAALAAARKWIDDRVT